MTSTRHSQMHAGTFSLSATQCWWLMSKLEPKWQSLSASLYRPRLVKCRQKLQGLGLQRALPRLRNTSGCQECSFQFLVSRRPSSKPSLFLDSVFLRRHKPWLRTAHRREMLHSKAPAGSGTGFWRRGINHSSSRTDWRCHVFGFEVSRRCLASAACVAACIDDPLRRLASIINAGAFKLTNTCFCVSGCRVLS